MESSWINEHKKMERAVNKTARGCGIIALVVAMCIAVPLMLCSGCRTIETTKEVPVITEHTTERYHTDIVRDTLYHRDSIYHYVQGDTVMIEKWHHIANVSTKIITDTIRDTIPKVVTVTRTEVKEVNFLHWWQQALMWAGGILLASGGLWIVMKVKRAG
ncbi:MAG: hypothetical protein SPL96_11110 [Bacteroidales bacterium]|nr:hypothetical protein [Bacteroidales bacterium]